jgi:hypothetical protein
LEIAQRAAKKSNETSILNIVARGTDSTGGKREEFACGEQDFCFLDYETE